ncbi:probable protein phosphatase DDB_G0279461 [Anastrepha obliqua]|uniref:probable protein phosphatase DDB_G0279461 n=1 Tax=Anastrepha obliqua TaxID=95512 RepID=UPI00240A79E9|nr:probable protein phosphatase DDB_G0279461 [Anastrepha obliqua]
MLLLTFIWLAPHICLQAQANSHYNKFKSITKAPTAATYTPSYSISAGLLPAGTHLTAATAYASEQVAWPPTLTHNNWFILQATAKAAVAADSAEIGADMANQPQQRFTEAEARAGREQTAHSLTRNNYAAHIKQQQQQQQQLPVKYYAYNNSNSGNYGSSAQDVRIVEPYALAFNNQRRQLMAVDEQDHRRVLRSKVNTDRAVNNAGYVNTKSNNHNNDDNNKSQSKHNQDSKNANIAQSNANNASNIVSQPQFPALFDWKDIAHDSYRYSSGDGNNNDNSNENLVDVDADDDDDNERAEIGSVEEAQLDEVVMPLARVLDKIKQFCDIWKQIISGGNEPDLASNSSHSIADGGETFEQAASATTVHATNPDTTIPAGDTTAQLLAAEVQGRRSAPTVKADTAHSIMQQSRTAAPVALLWPTAPRSTAVTASPTTTTTRFTTKNPASATATAKVIAKSLTSTALVIGRGKKWKKKLKKLILPLLLAYKLKFMALVPLLIGGLTLLVGSTGLAGFFFALFLTVMSLKSGGNANKSIIIKKDW